MKIERIYLMDFTFEEVEVIGIESIEEFIAAIEEGKIIKIKMDNIYYYINSDYIMYFE